MVQAFVLLVGLCHGGEPMQGYARACYDWQVVSRHADLDACTDARLIQQARRPPAGRGPLICTPTEKFERGR